MNEKFYIPDLVHNLRVYMKGCHISQLHRNEKSHPKQLYQRINPKYKTMTRLSKHLKVMSTPYEGHKFILVVID